MLRAFFAKAAASSSRLASINSAMSMGTLTPRWAPGRAAIAAIQRDSFEGLLYLLGVSARDRRRVQAATGAGT